MASSSSSTLQRSNDLVDLASSATAINTNNNNSTSFAPLHRTEELENLHDHINNTEEKRRPSTTIKKTLTKCLTVIGDGSDKQI